jgi:hypothetical protein
MDDSQDDREGVLRWLFDIIFVQQTAAGDIIEIPGDHCWLRAASESGCRSNNRGWQHPVLVGQSRLGRTKKAQKKVV